MAWLGLIVFDEQRSLRFQTSLLRERLPHRDHYLTRCNGGPEPGLDTNSIRLRTFANICETKSFGTSCDGTVHLNFHLEFMRYHYGLLRRDLVESFGDIVSSEVGEPRLPSMIPTMVHDACVSSRSGGLSIGFLPLEITIGSQLPPSIRMFVVIVIGIVVVPNGACSGSRPAKMVFLLAHDHHIPAGPVRNPVVIISAMKPLRKQL